MTETDSSTLRVGVTGAGTMGRAHCNAIQSHGATIASVDDLRTAARISQSSNAASVVKMVPQYRGAEQA